MLAYETTRQYLQSLGLDSERYLIGVHSEQRSLPGLSESVPTVMVAIKAVSPPIFTFLKNGSCVSSFFCNEKADPVANRHIGGAAVVCTDITQAEAPGGPQETFSGWGGA